MSETPRTPSLIRDLQGMSRRISDLEKRARVGFGTGGGYVAHASQHAAGGPDPVDHNLLANLTVGDPHPQYVLHTELPPGGGVSDHGLLTGLTPDDDHPHYALADKSRPATWVAAGDLAARSLADLGTRNHNDLQNYDASDNHAQYARLFGRVGTQQLSGSIDFGGNLELQGNNEGSAGSKGRVRILDRLVIDPGTYDPGTGVAWNIMSASGSISTSATLRALNVTPTITYNHASGSIAPFVLFSFGGTLTAATAKFLGAGQVLNFAPAVTLPGGSSMNVRVLIDNVALGDAVGGSNTMSLHTSVDILGSVGSGWTVVTWRGIRISTLTGAGGAGSITDLVVVDQEDNSAKATREYLARSSAGKARLQMYGAARLGDQTLTTDPESILHIAKGTQNGAAWRAALTWEADDTNPTAPTSGKMRMYLKGNFLVIQANAAGTVRYYLLDLTNAAVNWTQQTTAP